MQIYYETEHREEGSEFPTITAHDTIEEAIEFAEAHGAEEISEIGGSYTVFRKCWFCEEWVDIESIESDGACDRCHMEFKSRGEE